MNEDRLVEASGGNVGPEGSRTVYGWPRLGVAFQEPGNPFEGRCLAASALIRGPYALSALSV